MNKKWILVVAALFILVVFAVQNYEVVKVKFLFWSFATSRAIIIFSSLLIGFIIGMAVSRMRRN
ncbi:MAG: LapA family protein [Candidatus Omnitrophota bacterium]